jgi:protein SCO1/2
MRVLLAAVVLAVIAGGVALLVSGGGGKSSSTVSGGPVQSATTSASQASFRGAVASPPAVVPPLALRNYLGTPVNIDQYRGKAILVTFIYTHCPDVCPLITANLRVAQRLLGAQAAKAQIIAVSVDSRGDTRQAIAAFLARHDMTGHMQYLVGSTPELAKVWSAWNVGSERDAKEPELVNHSGLVYGISASGKITTLYPANFKPSDIAHDVPLLASQ